MADVTRDPEQDSPDYGHAFVLTSPVRLDQLSWEIGNEVGQPPVDLVGSGSPGAASEEEPALIYVEAGDADDAVVLSVTTSHVPDPTWFPARDLDVSIEAVIFKAQGRGVLNPTEIQVALRYLLTE